jgi:hypothetical protein
MAQQQTAAFAMLPDSLRGALPPPAAQDPAHAQHLASQVQQAAALQRLATQQHASRLHLDAAANTAWAQHLQQAQQAQQQQQQQQAQQIMMLQAQQQAQHQQMRQVALASLAAQAQSERQRQGLLAASWSDPQPTLQPTQPLQPQQPQQMLPPPQMQPMLQPPQPLPQPQATAASAAPPAPGFVWPSSSSSSSSSSAPPAAPLAASLGLPPAPPPPTSLAEAAAAAASRRLVVEGLADMLRITEAEMGTGRSTDVQLRHQLATEIARQLPPNDLVGAALRLSTDQAALRAACQVARTALGV